MSLIVLKSTLKLLITFSPYSQGLDWADAYCGENMLMSVHHRTLYPCVYTRIQSSCSVVFWDDVD